MKSLFDDILMVKKKILLRSALSRNTFKMAKIYCPYNKRKETICWNIHSSMPYPFVPVDHQKENP